MSYLLFVAASSFEYFSIFMLMFVMFRFRIKEKLLYMLLVAFLMSQVSHFTRLNPEIGDISSFIQLILFIVLFWVLFRIPFFYAIVMNVAGFICGFVIQGMTILAFGAAGLSLVSIKSSIGIASLIQLLSSLLIVALSLLISRADWGFDFIPQARRDAAISIKGTNAVLLSIIILGVSAAFVVTYLFRNEYEHYILTSCAVFVISLPFFVYYSIRKDHEDAE